MNRCCPIFNLPTREVVRANAYAVTLARLHRLFILLNRETVPQDETTDATDQRAAVPPGENQESADDALRHRTDRSLRRSTDRLAGSRLGRRRVQQPRKRVLDPRPGDGRPDRGLGRVSSGDEVRLYVPVTSRNLDDLEGGRGVTKERSELECPTTCAEIPVRRWG